MKNLACLLFDSARKYPQSTAVLCEDRSLTYRGLDLLVGRFVAFLRSRISEPGALVAVVAYKSIEAVAFTQAALRCGHAYTVVDPRFPVSRINAILRDGGPVVVYCDLAVAQAQAILAGLASVCVIGAGEGSQAAAGAVPLAQINSFEPSLGPPDDIRPNQLAYVLYTSGSTGVPKGVRISHANALYSIDWAQSELGFAQDEVFLNQAHFGFDFCVIDHYNAWNVGAAILMVPEYDAVFPAHVCELIRAHGVTSLWLVPSNIIAMIRQGGLLDLDASRLRRFLYGGEPFPMPFLRQIHEWMGGRNVFNLYGPTETNLVTSRRVTAQDLLGMEVPLGLAIPGTTLRVADEQGQLSVSGTGELWASCPSVALGYTVPEKSDAKRFVERDGMRWYRTGDLALIDDEAVVWYRGRTDHMVKVRGYRIELQEIETALAAIPGVRAATVLVHQREAGEKEIHAFCVTGDSVDAAQIKTRLAQKLPAFMVPHRCHLVEQIPCNDRGKVDREALRMAL